MNFVALDFETANSSRSSVCSIGIVEYENGTIKKEYYRLVKPKENYFSPMNIRVHGITKQDVTDAKEFDILWEEEIKPILEGKLVIAHNAQFDMGVLRAVLDQYQLRYPMLAYNCTVNISKKTWSLNKYNLNVVSDYLGFTFFHHHALEDAKAAGHILLCAKETLGASNVKDLIERTGTTNGMMYEGGYEPARLNKRKQAKKAAADVYVAASSEFNKNHPYYNSSFVFTGRLKKMKREEAIQYVVDLGGVYHSSVESTTNYIVLSDKSYANYRDGQKTNKLERTETLLSQGHSIEIIPESEFIQQLPHPSRS